MKASHHKSAGKTGDRFRFNFYYKLLAVFGITSLLILITCIFGYRTFRFGFSSEKDTIDDKAQLLVQISDLQQTLHTIHFLENTIHESSAAAEQTIDPATDLKRLEESVREFERRLHNLTTAVSPPIPEQARQLSRDWQPYHDHLQHILEADIQDRRPPYERSEKLIVFSKFKVILDDLNRLTLQTTNEIRTQLLSSTARFNSRWQLFRLILALCIVIGFIAVIMLCASASRRIKHLKQGIARLSQKDWSHPLQIRGNDEITDLTITFIEMKAELYEREQALIESERKHRSLIENLPEYIFHKDRNLVYIACNEKFARLLDLSPEQIIGKNDELLFSKDIAEEFNAEDQKIMATGNGVEIEYQFTQNNCPMWLHAIKIPVRDKYDTISGILGVLRDITATKTATEELRNSEEKFRQLAENINHVFFIIDRKTRKVLYVSPAYEALWDQPQATLLEDPHAFLEAVHPEDRQKVQSTYEAFEQNTSFDYEYRIVSKKGKTRWIYDRSFPIYDERGHIYRFARLAEDITERIALYSLIRESEERYRSLFEKNHAVMLLIDPQNGAIVDANPAACQFYGYDHAGMTQMHLSDINPLPEKELSDIINSVMNKHRDVHISTHRVANGNLRDVEIYSVSMHIDGKDLIYGIIHDVTNRIRAEKKIRQRLNIENALARSANLLISSEKADLDQVLTLLGHAFSADSVCLFRIQGRHRQTDLIHEWYRPEARNSIREVCAMDVAQNMHRGQQRVTDIKKESICSISVLCNHAEPSSLSDLNGKRSALCVPIFSGADTISGFIYIENFFDNRHWLAEDVEALGLAAEIVGSHWNRIDSHNELIQERQRLVKFLDGNPIPTIIINQSHQISLWNRACEALTGIMKEDVIHHKLSSKMFPLDTQKERPILANCVLDTDDSLLKHIYGWKNLTPSDLIPHAYKAFEKLNFGEGEKEFLLHAARVYDSKGEILGAIETLEDITEQQQAIKAMIKSEKRFRELVENALVGISIVQEGQIVYMNPRQKQLLGLKAHALTPPFYIKDIHIFAKDTDKFNNAHDIDYLSAHKRLDQVIRFYPFNITAENNDLVWVNCRSSIIEYQDQKAVLITMGDITRSKRLEKIIQVREKMASLGNVATGIAHEIRNPLSGINIMLDGIKETFEDPENAEDIKDLIVQAQKATNKIETVIRTVLDFSRPSTPQLIETDIHLAINEAINLCKTSLRKAGIQFDVHLDDRLPHVFIDTQLIEQVVLNIINNATESMQHLTSKKIIALTTERIDNDIILKIADSGPGIPDEIKEKIFEPFFTTKSNGSGIGLSICQRIIIDHGGSLHVAAAGLLGGTEFTISIPIEKRGLQT